MQERIGGSGVVAQATDQGFLLFLFSVPEEVVQRFSISIDSLVKGAETGRHALPRSGCFTSSISVSSAPSRLRPDFVLRYVGRLGRQGKQCDEVAPAQRIGTELPLEPPQLVLFLKQADHHAFRRGMLALRQQTSRQPGADLIAAECLRRIS